MISNTALKGNITDTSGKRSELSVIIYSVFLALILLLSLVGNVTVVTSITIVRRLREDISNIFLINLSITDMSNAVLVMLSSLIALSEDEWRMPVIWCDLQCAFNYCFIIVSMLTLGMISIDRYHATKNALEYSRIITKKRIYLMILYAWAQGLAFALTPMVLGWIQYDYDEVVCAIDWFKEPNILYYVIVANIMCFIIPGVVLFYCYAVVAATAKRLATGTHARTQHDSRMNRIIKSLVAIVVIFFICMTPFCITKLLKVASGNPKFVPGFVNTLATLIQYLASATNPFIYGIFRKDFRLGFKRQFEKLCCCTPCNAEGSMSNSFISRRRSTEIFSISNHRKSVDSVSISSRKTSAGIFNVFFCNQSADISVNGSTSTCTGTERTTELKEMP